VREKEDYKILRYIVERMKISPAYEAVDREIDELGLDGLSAPLISPFKKTPFQSLVEHFVGTEKLVYDLCDHPRVVEETLAVMRERTLEAVKISVESRAEAFISWEDSSSTNISPALFERYVVPDINIWGRIVHGAGKLLIHHACGHIRDLLPIMAREEVDAIESITPPPTGNIGIGEARALLGGSKALIGGLDPVRFLTLQGRDFDAYVEETLDEAGERGFILANSDSCPPGVEEGKFSRITKLVAARRGLRLAGY
jgi:uroporphyrinogen-III decarboxylase